MINKFYYKKLVSFGELDKEFNVITEEIRKLKIPDGFLQFIFYTIAELFANVKEHSKAKKISVEIKTEKDVFSTKIIDDGIGLRKSYISRGIFPKDDSSAIEFALSGLSTKSPKERGYGLYTIRQLVEALGGETEIKTGQKIAFIRKGKIWFKENLEKEKGLSILVKAKIQDINIYKIIK